MVGRTIRRKGDPSLPKGGRSIHSTVDNRPQGQPAPISTSGWRERLPDAMPLFMIGIASFAISYLTFHSFPASGGERLPLWSLFSAAGAMVVGGGAAVVVAGGEPAEPPYDSTDVVVLSKGEYAELTAKLGRLALIESELPSEPATPAVRPSNRARRSDVDHPSASVTRRPLDATPDAVPFQPRQLLKREIPTADSYLEDSPLDPQTQPDWRESQETTKSTEPHTPPRSVEHPTTISSSRQPPITADQTQANGRSPADATFERTLHELEAALGSLKPPSSRPTRAPSNLESRNVSSAPTGPEPSENLGRISQNNGPGRRRTVCTTCGTRVEDGLLAVRCEVCEESLCPSCQLRAEYEGHPRSCARCNGILALAEEDDTP